MGPIFLVKPSTAERKSLGFGCWPRTNPNAKAFPTSGSGGWPSRGCWGGKGSLRCLCREGK